MKGIGWKNVIWMSRGDFSIISGLRWNTRDTSATWTTPTRRSPSPTRAWRWCGPGWAQRGRKSQLCDGGQRDTPWHDMGDQWWCPELEHDRGHVSRVYFLMLHAVTKHYTKSDTVMWIIWRDVVGCCCFHFIARVIRHCETEVHRPGARWLPDTVLTDKYNDGRAQRSRKSDKSWHIQKLSYSQILQLLLITLDSRYVYILVIKKVFWWSKQLRQEWKTIMVATNGLWKFTPFQSVIERYIWWIHTSNLNS